MKICFDQLRGGEKFTTPYSKRLMTCVKVAPTDSRGFHILQNAVVLLDHTGQAAEDIGEMLIFDRSDEVEVDEQIHKYGHPI